MSKERDRRTLKLAELRANQQAKRLWSPDGNLETDELQKVKVLAWNLFGDEGLIEWDPRDPALVHIGPIDRSRPIRPGQAKPMTRVLSGSTYRELLEQATLWRSSH